jgi:protein TonB
MGPWNGQSVSSLSITAAIEPGRSVERLVGWGIVVTLHLGLLAVLNSDRVREPPALVPALVTVRIAPEREPETVDPATPLPPRPEFRITVPPPRVEVDASAAITLPAQVQAATPTSPPRMSGSPVAGDGPAVVSSVEYLRAPEPRYPPASRAAHEEGLVLLRVLVDEHGRAQTIDVLRSSGHSRLDEAARAAVRRALFKPHLENGAARAALVTVPIEFAVRTSRPSLAQR